jgi:hypothetical protein
VRIWAIADHTNWLGILLSSSLLWAAIVSPLAYRFRRKAARPPGIPANEKSNSARQEGTL